MSYNDDHFDYRFDDYDIEKFDFLKLCLYYIVPAVIIATGFDLFGVGVTENLVKIIPIADKTLQEYVYIGSVFGTAGATHLVGKGIVSVVDGSFKEFIDNLRWKISNSFRNIKGKKKEKVKEKQKIDTISVEKINKKNEDDGEKYIEMISENIVLASKLKYNGYQADINRLYKLAETYMKMREYNPYKSGVDIIRENPKFMFALNDIESIINTHKKNQDSLVAEKELLSELSKQIPVSDEYTDEIAETDFTSGEATIELPKLKR